MILMNQTRPTCLLKVRASCISLDCDMVINMQHLSIYPGLAPQLHMRVMRFAHIVLMLCLSSFAYAERYALLVGINTYPHLEPKSQLTACVNDVNLMKELLVDKCGFPAANVILLTDQDANAAGIKNAIKKHLID